MTHPPNAAGTEPAATVLGVAFVLPYGEPSDAFFADTLIGLLCADARRAGHRAEQVRVYYDGRDPDADRAISERLERWLAEQQADLVVVERLFAPEPVVRHLARAPGRRCLQVTRGDSLDPIEGVDLVLGALPGPTRTGTRRAPTIAELREGFRCLLDALAAQASVEGVPGLARVAGGRLIAGAPAGRGAPQREFAPVVEQHVICSGPPPRVVRKTLFGNVGCPFAADPAKNPHYAGLAPPPGVQLAALGCTFCHMGGDYEKRPDDAVVADLVEQARYFARHMPEITEYVLSDQHPIRYLAALLRAAHAAGVPPARWLFPARADSFVREIDRIRQAIAVAEQTGHALEVHLSGFEAFADRELERYNKGCSAAELLDAVRAMRRLSREHPAAFQHARARSHSLVLWNPWTTLEDLGASLDTIRTHGLRELFHEIGRNRLRLYRDLPIFYAAERDGAVVERWDDGDEGAARRKGYSVEQPWRFLDARTRIAHDLARALRDRLGLETELAQLRAAADAARRIQPGAAAATAEMLAALDRLAATLLALAGDGTRPHAVPRGRSEPAAPVRFAGACNNGCSACANRDSFVEDDAEALGARIDAARLGGRALALAGREPTVHPAFLALLERARGTDQRRVGVVGNGRRFAYSSFTAAAVRGGLRAASIKLFAPEPGVADAISRDPGGWDQACSGVRALLATGACAVEIRAPLHRRNLAQLERYAALTRELGAQQLRVEAALDAVGLDALGAATDALDRLVERCATESVALEASPLAAATTDFRWLPRAGE